MSIVYLSPLTKKMMETRHPGMGAIVTPSSHRLLPPDLVWAADNGCFAQGDKFRLDRYLDWLSRPVGALKLCLFATAPDVIGDWAATWERSRDVLPQLRALGYPAAIVLQNGVTLALLEPLWDRFDVVFVGGDNAFKLAESTYAIVREAKRRGKWAHMGRVNGEGRLRAAATGGYDSADGTGLVYAPDALWPRVTGWVDRINAQPSMHMLEAV